MKDKSDENAPRPELLVSPDGNEGGGHLAKCRYMSVCKKMNMRKQVGSGEYDERRPCYDGKYLDERLLATGTVLTRCAGLFNFMCASEQIQVQHTKVTIGEKTYDKYQDSRSVKDKDGKPLYIIFKA